MKFLFKKIFIILMVCSFSMNISFAASFNWTKVTKAKDGSFEFYYDKKTVFKVGQNTYFWQMTNNLKNIEDNVYSNITHNMANCVTYEVKALIYSSYKRPMGRGILDIEAVVPADFPDYYEWVYYDKETTVQGQVLNEICN
jgi:hypothetical protein